MNSAIPMESLQGSVVLIGKQRLFVEHADGLKPRGICEVELMPDGTYTQKGQRRQFHGEGNESAEVIAEEYFREFKR